MHLTLKFISHVADEKLPEIAPALAQVTSSAPIELHYRGIGFFPNPRRASVLWCGVETSASLAELAAGVESALEPLGIARESRDFTPHLTLARLGRSAKPGNLVLAVQGLQDQDFGESRETEFHLYESILKSSGAEYKKLQSYSFVRS
jgi:2'-5' RNA ligase